MKVEVGLLVALGEPESIWDEEILKNENP